MSRPESHTYQDADTATKPELTEGRESPPKPVRLRRPATAPLRIEIAGDRVLVRPNDRRRRPMAERRASQLQGRPFLKWAGGKQWFARVVSELLPPSYDSYFEPFLGGGSVFFAIQPNTAYLSDANSELIQTYDALRKYPDSVIDHLSRLKYDRKVFNEMRQRKPRTPWTHAARFIYLNRTAFNGIYRVNQLGEFNVPFGRFSQPPTICHRERLVSCSAALNDRVQVHSYDFERAVEAATENDLVYFDPPYITGHMNNGFVKWNSRLFTWSDQERLALLARSLVARGIHVLVSNADHPAVTDLYAGLHCYRLSRSSQIGGPSASRRRVTEALLSSYPIMGFESK